MVPRGSTVWHTDSLAVFESLHHFLHEPFLNTTELSDMHQAPKCLFIIQDTVLSFNYSGAGSRRMMDFLALKELGFSMFVVRFYQKVLFENISAFEASAKAEMDENRSACQDWKDIEYSFEIRPKSELIRLDRMWKNPINYRYSNIDQYSSQVENLLKRWQIDLVWTCSSTSAIIVSQIPKSFPWVNYIGDWRYRLRLLRMLQNKTSRLGRWKQRFLSYLDKKVELASIKHCDYVETSSVIQAKELRHFGIKKALAIPQFHQGIDNFGPVLKSEEFPKIIHLGALETTSNRVGLIEYFDHAHDQLCSALEKYKLTIIGNQQNSSSYLTECLKREKVNCLGHVNDLNTIISPLDIGIIPYTQNTGMRTKIALFHSLGMAVLSFRKPVEGMKEIKDGYNAILVDDFSQFNNKLIELCQSPDLREELATNGFRTYQKVNSLQSQLHHYKQILDEVKIRPLENIQSKLEVGK